jgi:hypothetical protein
MEQTGLDGGFGFKKVDRSYKVEKSDPFSALGFKSGLLLQLPHFLFTMCMVLLFVSVTVCLNSVELCSNACSKFCMSLFLPTDNCLEKWFSST